MKTYSIALLLALASPGLALAAPVVNAPAKTAAAGPATFFPLSQTRIATPRKPSAFMPLKTPAQPPARAQPQQTAGMTPQQAQQILSIYSSLD